MMGRRRKSVALKQSSSPPVVEEPIVATPEQIEEIKKEGAKDIAKEVDKKIQEDLQELAPEEPKLKSVEILEEGAGLVYSEDYVEDPNVENTLVTKSPASVLDEFPDVPFPEVEEKKLSVVDKRRKLRYGMKPNK